jgi:uncharacterized protein (TIGR00730 family)
MAKVVSESEDTVEIVETALSSLWSVVNELSRIKASHQPRYRVTLFGSARILPGDPIYAQAKELARRLAASGCDIVTGGGPGLMQAANEGENLGDPEHKTESTGIRVELPFEQGANAFVEKAYMHRTFYSRLHHFVRLSSAFVVLGGGIGTALETFLVWQLLQVRHAEDVPLVLVGEMWKELVAWARRHMLAGATPLVSAQDLEIPVCVDDIDAAFAIVDAHRKKRDAGR